MAFISILASPQSVHSAQAHAKALHRMATCFAVAGFLLGGSRLLSAPATGSERTEQRMNEGGAPARAGRAGVNAPQYSPAASGLRSSRRAPRPAVGSSAIAWSGAP
jgi:hypothetical protein